MLLLTHGIIKKTFFNKGIFLYRHYKNNNRTIQTKQTDREEKTNENNNETTTTFALPDSKKGVHWVEAWRTSSPSHLSTRLARTRDGNPGCRSLRRCPLARWSPRPPGNCRLRVAGERERNFGGCKSVFMVKITGENVVFEVAEDKEWNSVL